MLALVTNAVKICFLEDMAEYMCFKVFLGSETCILNVLSLCINSRESQKTCWHRKMLPDKRWLCYFCLLHEGKALHLEVSFQSPWKQSGTTFWDHWLKGWNQGCLSTRCMSWHCPPRALNPGPPGLIACPVYRQVPGLCTAIFHGMSLPRCGCAKQFR